MNRPPRPRTYNTREEAIAAGVPPEAIRQVRLLHDSRNPPNQPLRRRRRAPTVKPPKPNPRRQRQRALKSR